MAAVQLRFLFIPFFTSIVGEAQYVMQDAALMHYIDRRILSIEQCYPIHVYSEVTSIKFNGTDSQGNVYRIAVFSLLVMLGGFKCAHFQNTKKNRLEKCNQDIMDYVQEFREFSKKMTSRLEGLGVLKTELKNDMDHLLTRVERAQRDIDYFESAKESPTTCMEIDEDLVVQQLIEQEESKQKVKLMLNASCNDMLAGIKSLKIVKKAGDIHGSWLKDPGKNFQKIYFLTGTKNKTVMEFANIRVFTESGEKQLARRVNLPFPWQGTGHAIYHGFLFYHKYGSLNEIIKFDIQKRNVTNKMMLSGAGETAVYALYPFTKIDLAVDELGLWAIHAEPGTEKRLVLTKMSHETLAVEYTWDTPCKSENAEAAFMMCGALYVVYNSPSGGTSRIECIYDTLDIISPYESPVLHFPRRQTSHSMVHYYPREKQLFAWDNGAQVIYKLLTKPKS